MDASENQQTACGERSDERNRDDASGARAGPFRREGKGDQRQRPPDVPKQPECRRDLERLAGQIRRNARHRDHRKEDERRGPGVRNREERHLARRFGATPYHKRCPEKNFEENECGSVHVEEAGVRRHRDLRFPDHVRHPCCLVAAGTGALCALLTAHGEDHFEERLRHGRERVGIAVGEVDFFVREPDVIGDRDVRADADAVAAAVGIGGSPVTRRTPTAIDESRLI
jgi:hypothetical protein